MNDDRHAAEMLTGNYFVANYPPFSCWNQDDVGSYRRALDRRDNMQTPLGLYIHIPFCAQRCSYCYYLSYDNRPEDIERYIDALVNEVRLYAAKPAIQGRDLKFVYFGGGTPSLLTATQLQSLVNRLQRYFPWHAANEVTFECAPKSITERKLMMLRESGVTRISLGAQQLDDSVLKQNGRIHLMVDIERAYEAIRRPGFDVVNIDLIVGLIGESDESFLASLDRVIDLAPDSVTIYQLEIPANTPLYRSLKNEEITPPADWTVKRNRLAQGLARLEACRYTVRSAYTAVHDSAQSAFLYQDDQYRGADLLGIGVSSFSHLAGVNHQNISSLDSYLAAVCDSELPLQRAYALSEEERMVREFVLQLKLGVISCKYFRDKFGVDLMQRFAEPLGRNAERGLLEVENDEIRFTRDGLLRADHLLLDFYLEQHRGLRYC